MTLGHKDRLALGSLPQHDAGEHERLVAEEMAKLGLAPGGAALAGTVARAGAGAAQPPVARTGAGRLGGSVHSARCRPTSRHRAP